MIDEIGERIAELRKERGWTQAELAKKLKVSPKTVSKWECGGGCPSVEFYQSLAEVFDVSIDYIMIGEFKKEENDIEMERENEKIENGEDIVVEVKEIATTNVVTNTNAENDNMIKTERMIESASIKEAVGADLLNIYFKPATENYARAEIDLYLAEGFYDSIFSGSGVVAWGKSIVKETKRQPSGGRVIQLMAKYKVPNDKYFLSVCGLAEGVYGYKLRQFNTKGELLFETDYRYIRI